MKNLTKIMIIFILLYLPSLIFADGQQEVSTGSNETPQFQLNAYSGSDGMTGKQIMEKANSTLIASNIVADITMKLVNKSGYERVREISIKSKEDNNFNKSVMHFTSPADVKGTGFLMMETENGDTDMWLYLPELKKVRKIVSSGKNDSFMGSDISYSDMEEKPLSDYTFNRYEDAVVDGEDCYVVENVSADDSVVKDTGYSRTIYWISKEKLIPLQAAFFNTKGDYYKKMTIQKIQEQGGTWIPSYIEVEDLKKQHKTVMELKNIDIDTDPDDSFFTQQYLKRGN